MKQIIVLLLFVKILTAQDDGILCSARTCSDYISANPCPPVPDSCNIQNSTHNGIFLPSPDPCNCCKYCLENLKEGDYCAEGEVGGLIPDSICGPGLTCASGLCVKMNDLVQVKTPPPCSKAQGEYDQRRKDGILGSMEIRPDCDDDGFFLPYQCITGQTCFCLDKNGNRIFGEIPYTTTANLILKCECPRKFQEVLKFFDEDLHPNQHFRCTETGDYDTIQCIGDNCMCTDAPDGSPTFPMKDTVNISSISEKTLSDCFNKDRHLTGKYYYQCAEKYLDILEEVENYISHGYDTVFEVEFPKCDLDGTYAPVQKDVRINPDNTEETYYYCANPDGTHIDNYEGVKDTDMDCKCARTSLLIPENASEKPKCCPNGSFDRVQCRRGKCYCVDSNGYQDVNNSGTTKAIEVSVNDKEKLFCYEESCSKSS